MIFSVLPNTVTSLFLSANLITSLTFKDEVRSFIYGGVKEEIFSELANNNKTLVIKVKKKGIDTNLIIVTSKNRYYFSVKGVDKYSHQFIEIEDGIINSNFKKIKETDTFELFEGMTSIMVVNKSKTPIIINDVEVSAKEYFSKGVPLIMDGSRILN
jgi:hypothetical protein